MDLNGDMINGTIDNPIIHQSKLNDEVKVTYDELLKLSNIAYISLDEGYIIKNKAGQYIKIMTTSIDNPFIVRDNSLTINIDYFLTHPQLVDEILCNVCKNTKSDDISIIDKALITQQLLESLKSNTSLKDIKIARYERQPQRQYFMNQELFDMFKDSGKRIYTSGVDPELENNFSSVIGYNVSRKLIGYNNYNDLQDISRIIYVREAFTLEELENLKYLPDGKTIHIHADDLDISEVIKIVNRINNLGNRVQIKIDLKDKEVFNSCEIFTDEKYENMDIIINDTNFLDYKRYESILYSFIKDVNDTEYSPFEKYIYAYNITKRFKEYKENDEDRTKARNIYDILFNEYMVCVGYAKMLNDLLRKMGFESKEIPGDLYIRENEEDVYKSAGHARTYIHIEDPKYGISGYYIADPTWDNDIENDYYNHLAMTSIEATRQKNLSGNAIKYDNISVRELFYIDSLDEFYEKVNYIINNKINNNYEIHKIYKSIIHDILQELKLIDKSMYDKFISKYSQSGENPFLDSNKDITIEYNQFVQIISDLGNYIVSKVNNPISGKSIIDAAMVVNTNIFGFNEEQSIEYRSYLIDINKKRQDKYFKKRTIENVMTGEIVYENETNKFDIEDSKKL